MKEPKIVNPLDDQGDVKWGTNWEAGAKHLTAKQRFSLSELKRLIRYKYGSVKIFSQASGISIGQINTLIYGRYRKAVFDQKLKEMVDVIQRTDNTIQKKFDPLDYDTRVWIKMRLYAKFKNVQNFCRLFPEFSPGYIVHVFKGRKKNQCPRIQRLIQILNATYHDEPKI